MPRVKINLSPPKEGGEWPRKKLEDGAFPNANNEVEHHIKNNMMRNRTFSEYVEDAIKVEVFLQLFKAEVKGRDSGRLLNSVLEKLPKRPNPIRDDRSSRIKALLLSLINRAKRQNIWRRLSSIGKGVITLSISLQHIKFKGELLIRSLIKALKELLCLLNPLFRYWLEGLELAYKMSEVAYKWGNRKALKWKCDDNYIICLGMNKLGAFKLP